MAENITLARPYASAAFELADESASLDAWSRALEAAATAASDAGFQALTSSPRVRPEQLADLLTDVAGRALAGEQGTVAGQTANLFRIMAENRRLHVLPEVRARFDELKAEKQNILNVKLISATPVSDSLRHRFAQALEKKLGRGVRLDCEVDESLIGGAVIQADDMVIDGSLRGRLEKLAGAMTQ